MKDPIMTEIEKKQLMLLMAVLRPILKRPVNGRYQLIDGTKTELGLFRTVKRALEVE